MPEPVTIRHFAAVLLVAAHALVRLALLLTGTHFTRAGRKVYR